jgi:acyl-CoA thioester hydrolase
MEDFNFYHTFPIQIRFTDVDRFGHVNNTIYFTYFDLGKIEYFASACPVMDLRKDGVVVVHIETDFLSQILANDRIAVQTAVSEIGNKSLILIQQIIDTTINEIKCTCKSILVAFDLERKEAKEVPEEWKEAIYRYVVNNCIKKSKK